MQLNLAKLTALLAPVMAVTTISALVYRQIAAVRRRRRDPADGAPDFSPDRYWPMLRLLDEGDIRFLRSQPGATRALEKRLRQQRCRIFRGYLRHLENDFRLVSEELLLAQLHCQPDRRDLVGALIGSQLKFAFDVFRIRCRLLGYSWGVRREPVTRLVSLMERLNRELAATARNSGAPTAIPQPS